FYAHQRERVGALHRRELAGEGYDPPKRARVEFRLSNQRADFLFPATARSRTLLLAAAGFFLVSAPMLARNASIRLMTRCGWRAPLGCSTARPACLARNISISAFS